MNSFPLEKLDDRFETTARLTVVIHDEGVNVLRWTAEGGYEREINVDIEYAREAYRAARRAGFEESTDDDEPYFNEEELYEAAVDARMSRVYAAEPEWAI